MNATNLKINGIKCDAPGCDYKDDTVRVEDYKLWLNKSCPKCGANLLTQADYDVVQGVIKVTNFLNLPVIRHLLKLFSFGKKTELKINLHGTGQVEITEKT